MHESIHHITQELPSAFVAKVLASDSVADLNKMLSKEVNGDKCALIQARIDNINYLVS